MSSSSNSSDDNDMDLVAVWLKKDPRRWIAGILAGVFAGILMLAFAALLSSMAGHEPLFAVKLGALPFLGNVSTDFASSGAVVVGFIAIEVLAAFLGLVYAHFTGTNALAPLLGVGIVWGIFGWIFISNLFIQSFQSVKAAHISSGASFFAWMVFGVALTSVSFFDRMLRGK